MENGDNGDNGIKFNFDESVLSNSLSYAWWMQPKKDVYNAVFTEAKDILRYNQARNNIFRMYAAKYEDTFNVAMNGVRAMDTSADELMVTHNVIGSAVDAVVNQVFKDPPRIRILPTNGGGKLSRQCKKLGQFADGCKTQSSLDVMAPRAGKDSLVCGTGFLYCYTDMFGNPRCENVWPGDVLVDHVQGSMMRPREQMLCTMNDVISLCQAFPKQAELIAKATRNKLTAVSTVGARSSSLSNNVTIIEAWRLPSAPGANDGRHVACCSTCTLVDESWMLESFPLIPIRWRESQQSYWGTGIAQQLFGLQNHINQCCQYFVESMAMVAMPRILVPEENMISQEIYSRPGALIPYNNAMGQPIPLIIPSIQPQDFIPWLQWQHEFAFQLIGLNEGSVNASTPLGPNASGAAQREYRDTQSVRLSDYMKQWDRLHSEATKMMIELVRIDAETQGFNIRVQGRKFLEGIKWKDASVAADCYQVKAMPSANLPNTPSGRFALINEMAQQGLMSREVMAQQLDIPDPDGVLERFTSQFDRLDKIIDEILEEQKPGTADEFLLATDQSIVVQIVVEEINKAFNNDEDKRTIDLLVDFLNSCIDTTTMSTVVAQKLAQLTAAMSPPPPPVGGPAGGPAGVPGPAGAAS